MYVLYLKWLAREKVTPVSFVYPKKENRHFLPVAFSLSHCYFYFFHFAFVSLALRRHCSKCQKNYIAKQTLNTTALQHNNTNMLMYGHPYTHKLNNKLTHSDLYPLSRFVNTGLNCTMLFQTVPSLYLIARMALCAMTGCSAGIAEQ